MQRHYNYVFDNITKTYNFVTKNKILYRVAFIVDETFSVISGENIPNVFQLVIEKTNDGVQPLDIKVSKTIEDIIERFFQNIDNSLIYICSEESNKAKSRQKVFNRWYKVSKHRNKIVKIDNVITVNVNEVKHQKLYTSIMFHVNNPNHDKLMEIYNQIENVLNEEK